MKKLISLLLVVMMLCSISTVAFAATEDPEVGGVAKFVVTQENGKDVSASQKTDVWLQVEASGQIDVTVPLVLVFKTNIDGGEAATAEDNVYAIYNNSTADLAVTEIKADVTAQNAATNPMELLGENDPLTNDKYSVVLDVAGVTNSKGQSYAAYHLDVNSIENSKTTGGAPETPLFVLLKNADGANNDKGGTPTPVTVTMNTGKLGFVTKEDDTARYGLKLLSLTYTVAINTSDAIDDEIVNDPNVTITGHGHNDDGSLKEYGYTYAGTNVTETEK